MPTQPPHHVSSLIFRISDLFRISTFVFRIYALRPNAQNEPNLPPRTHPAALAEGQSRFIGEPNSRTGTVPARRDAPAMRNKPNSAYRWRPAGFPIPKLRKTNPIPQGQLPKAKSQPPNIQNEPNYPPAAILPPQTHPEMRKTNPISVRARSRRAGMPLQYETNPILACHPAPILYGVPPQRRIGAGKRTQFRAPPANYSLSKRSGDPDSSGFPIH